MRIVLAGAKCSGKSTVGAKLAESLGVRFYETDGLIEDAYEVRSGERLSFIEIYRRVGEEEFRELEREAVFKAEELDYCVLSIGGGTFLKGELRRSLRKSSVLVGVMADAELLWERLQGTGSKYLNDGKEKFAERCEMVMDVIGPYADITVWAGDDAGKMVEDIRQELADELAVRSSAANTFGEVVRVTTFGESHGRAVGAVLDGLRPGVEIDEGYVQKELDRRRPGQSKVSTARNEADKVEILSGVFEGKSTGTPIAMVIYNKDQDSSKYDYFRDVFRPGHADLTFWKKYGVRDHRGGGRSSGRETAGRVAGGAVAKRVLAEMGVEVVAYSKEIAGVKGETVDFAVIEENVVRSADAAAAGQMEEAIIKAKREGDSVGGVVELVVRGVPAGLGDPVFGKLDARLAKGICSLGAVKGVEFGDGFAAAGKRGSEFNDAVINGEFASNHAGGVLGGISSGQDIVVRIAVKPTPSISLEQDAADKAGEGRKLVIEGRHDPCIVPRIVPVVESMAALVVLDAWEVQERIRPGWSGDRS